MYNEERKQEFLKQKSFNANLLSVFNLVEARETMYGRDLCEWNSDQILQFYRYFSTGKLQTLIVINTALRDYASWCILNGMVPDNQNHYAELGTDALLKCINMGVLAETVITYAKLQDLLNRMVNACDKFIVLGLFEGIPLTDNAMGSVKVTDLDGNQLHLVTGKILTVSDQLKNIILDASEEEACKYEGDKPRKDKIYVPSEYILRHTRTSVKNDSPIMTPVAITRRLRNRIRKLEVFSYSPTVKSFQESGRIYYIRKHIMETYGIGFEEAIFNKKYRAMHETIYGEIQNMSYYMQTYGVVVEQLKEL